MRHFNIAFKSFDFCSLHITIKIHYAVTMLLIFDKNRYSSHRNDYSSQYVSLSNKSTLDEGKVSGAMC